MPKQDNLTPYSLEKAVCADPAIIREAEEIINDLIREKRLNHALADDRKKKSMENARRFALDSIEYGEKVDVGRHSTTLRDRFIQLANTAGYKSREKFREITDDLVIVSALARQSQMFFRGGARDGRPTYGCFNDGDKACFMLIDSAIHVWEGTKCDNSYLAARRRNGETTPLRPAQVAPRQETDKEKVKREAKEKAAQAALAPAPIVLPDPVTPAPVIPTTPTPALIIPAVTVETLEKETMLAEIAALKAANAKLEKKELKLQKAAPIAAPAVANGLAH